MAGELVAENFEGWSPAFRQEFAANAFNHQVGSVLLSETERVKVWSITVPPGSRLPAHRNVLDYFWTALADGASIQHTDDGMVAAGLLAGAGVVYATSGSGPGGCVRRRR